MEEQTSWKQRRTLKNYICTLSRDRRAKKIVGQFWKEQRGVRKTQTINQKIVHLNRNTQCRDYELQYSL
jgi:hypothetical protein